MARDALGVFKELTFTLFGLQSVFQSARPASEQVPFKRT